MQKSRQRYSWQTHIRIQRGLEDPGGEIADDQRCGRPSACGIFAVSSSQILTACWIHILTTYRIDDIEDSSTLRRGFPVAHRIFGIPQTINSANFMYFQAQSRLSQLHQPDAFEIFTEELLRLHRGQGMDLHWRDSLTCPTEEDYIEMISNKTGGLFRLAIKLMQLQSESSQ
jgi:geranylgeranyl pyrophosphate synthase